MRYLDPTNDLAFRKIFGDEHHQESLISLINAVLGLTGERRVVSVTIANPYQVPKLEGLKETIVDVRAKDAGKREFIVEMQCEGGVDWVKRALYAVSKAVVNQLGKGNKYHLIQPVYFIGILKFAMPWDKLFPWETLGQGGERSQPERPWLPHFVLKEAKTNLEMTRDFSLHFMELAGFHKELADCHDIVEKWAWFFKNASELEEIPAAIQEPGLIQAFQTSEWTRWSPEELHNYENMMQFKAMAEHQLEEKWAEGKAEGKLEGKLEEKQEIARQLQKLGMPIEAIAQALRSPVEAVREWLA